MPSVEEAFSKDDDRSREEAASTRHRGDPSVFAPERNNRYVQIQRQLRKIPYTPQR